MLPSADWVGVDLRTEKREKKSRTSRDQKNKVYWKINASHSVGGFGSDRVSVVYRLLGPNRPADLTQVTASHLVIDRLAC